MTDSELPFLIPTSGFFFGPKKLSRRRSRESVVFWKKDSEVGSTMDSKSESGVRGGNSNIVCSAVSPIDEGLR